MLAAVTRNTPLTRLDVGREIDGHLPALRRYAIALCRSAIDADDLVQDTVLRALKANHQFRAGTDLRAWLFRIMYTVYISHLRKQAVRDRVHRQLPSGELSVDAQQQLRLEAQEVLVALQTLPEVQREAVMSAARDEGRYEDLAKKLGIPVGTFMSRLSRGREALRRASDGANRPRLKIVGKEG
jgi:RNA polymerase sigma-70 factor (ECF subfamily)